jgi:hypothetical protein
VAGGREARAEPAPGIEEVLVERVAIGAQLQREHVDGDVVERDGHEDLALARREVLLDRCHQRRELLAALGLIAGPGRQRVGKLVPRQLLGARRVVLPGVARDLGGDLEDHELVGPGGEPAEPLEVVEPGQDLHHRVVGALLRDVVELRARERPQLATATVQLVDRRALQHVVELGGGALVARVVGAQLLDPAPRCAVSRRRALDRRVGRGGFDAHAPIVVPAR